MVSTLPSGTVTFLFTDIEGSTQLWQQHPSGMPQALARHHAILRQSIEAQQGYVFQIVGDAFCAAFHTALNGTSAAVAAQQALAAEPWMETGPLKVRMALHTGAAEIHPGETTSGEYASGLTLSRASRLLSAGHGGQVLLSQATRDLLVDDLPPEITLRDLGEHRLKGLVQLEHIYQLLSPGMTADFPSLNTLDRALQNLPADLTSFIGREHEMAALKAYLAPVQGKTTRLVTLTGSGGVGKTRLALKTAEEVLGSYPQGVWWVELAPVTDPALVPDSVAAVLEIQERGSSVEERLVQYLGAKKLLLILDNCEHLVEACARLAASILRGCPQVQIIATSREALGLPGEIPFQVPSLSIPGSGLDPKVDDLGGYESIRLFVERTATHLPGFQLTPENAPAVVQICRRLDGIPLAIELAAARVKVLRVGQVAERLDDRFRLLTGGSRTALPRQQTLRAAIDWSYSLLSEEERILLRRLAIFSGGWMLEAAESVCAWAEQDLLPAFAVLDLLTGLVNKSMVVAERRVGRETRYSLLETIRQYAREKLLDTGEIESLRKQHLHFYTAYAEAVESESLQSQQVEWLGKLRLELDNFRTAMEWALQDDPATGLRLASTLRDYWYVENYAGEGARWLRSFLDKPENAAHTLARGRAAGRLANLSMLAQSEMAKTWAEESLKISREIQDAAGEMYALKELGKIAYVLEMDPATAHTYFEQGLAISRAIAHRPGMASILYQFGNLAEFEADFALARNFLEQSLDLGREIGNRRLVAQALAQLGDLLVITKGDLGLGRKMIEEADQIQQSLNSRRTNFYIYEVLSDVHVWQGNLELAREYREINLENDRLAGIPIKIARSALQLAALARFEGNDASNKQAIEEELVRVKKLAPDYVSDWAITRPLCLLAYAFARYGDLARAGEMLHSIKLSGLILEDRIWATLSLGYLALVSGDGRGATQEYRQSLKMAWEHGYRLWALLPLEGCAWVLSIYGEHERAAAMLGAAAQFRSEIGAPVFPGDRAQYERVLTDIKAALGESGFAAAWEKGSQGGMARAVEENL